MGLLLRVRGRPRRRRTFRFDDAVPHVTFGRDPVRCQVLFAQRLRAIGAEHCALERVLGEYRWILNAEHEVYVDGVRVMEGDVLPPHGTLRLGRRGPRLFFAHGEHADAPVLQPLRRLRVGVARVRQLTQHVRRNTVAVIALVALLLVVTAGTAVAIQGQAKAPEDTAATRLRAVLEEAAPSVYRTIVRTRDGSERTGGTAFVVGKHLLATNVHVAEAFTELRPGSTYLVRSGGAVPRTHEVTGVRFHPGWDTFELAWRHYGPSYKDEDRVRPVSPPGWACDVALLEVAPSALLGPPLRPASIDRLLGLQPGEPVASVGFPSERMALGGSSTRRPVPTVQTGALTAVTTFFGSRGAAENHTLIQHSCPGAGGSSGSPLLDAEGRVIGVLHAGNFAFGFHGRIPLGVGVNFAQSAVFLHELLDDRATDAMIAREERWQGQLEALYVSGAEIDREALRKTALESPAWDVAVPADPDQPIFEPLVTRLFDVPRKAVDDETARCTLALPRGGCYAILVWQYGDRQDRDVVVTAHDRHGASLGVVAPVQTERPVRARRLVVAKAGTLVLEAEPGVRPVRFHVEVLRGEVAPPPAPAPASAATAAQGGRTTFDPLVVRTWRARLEATLGNAITTTVVHTDRVMLRDKHYDGSKSWSEFISLSEAGLYMIETQVVQGTGVKVESPGEDADWPFPYAAKPKADVRVFYVSKALRLYVRLTGSGPDPDKIETLLRIHRVRAKP